MKKVSALTPLFLSVFGVALAQGTPTTNTWYGKTPHAGTTQYIEIATLQPRTPSTAGVRLVAYQPSDGFVNAYLVMGPVFGVATYSVLDDVDENIWSSPPVSTTTPRGTLILDSSSASYPPISYTAFGGNQTVLGKLAVGAPTPVASASTTAMFDVNVTNSLARLHNVGIVTSASGAKLEVDENVKLTAGSGASVTYQDNTIQTNAWNGVLQGGDYAESVDITGDLRQYEPGDVLVIDREAEGHFIKASTPYSTGVMGIYSTRPGVVGRRQKSDRSLMAEEVPMATIGVEGKYSATTVAKVRLPARPDNHGPSTTSQKNFAFEVIAIHPLKPNFSPYDKAAAPVGNVEPSPSGFSSTMVPGMLIELAYGTTTIDQMPKWFSTWYSINARVADQDVAAWQKQSNKHELLRLAIQSMLRERFKLLVHERPIQTLEYALVVQKHGVKFKQSVPGAALPQGFSLPSGGVRTLDLSGRSIVKMHFYNATMADLLDVLEGTSPGHPVRDATGLTGHYNFSLERDPDSRPEDPIFTFPVDSLGLQLKQVMTQSVAIVIDHVETPSPN